MITPERLAGAPISWGVCEVPGWGVMLPADRVLDEMRSLGLSATELGAPGFLPDDPDEVAALLRRHEMTLVGAFVPVVAHDSHRADETRRQAAATADSIRRAGGTMFVSALVADLDWSAPQPLTDGELDHTVGMLAELDEICAARGLTHALHPHVGTLVERADDVRRLLDRSSVAWCLDTGHLHIGGYDPLQFAADAAGRVVHAHLKDVDGALAARLGRGDLAIHAAVIAGVFRPLGQGDTPIADTVARLEADGFDGWYVLEQDTDLGPVAPADATGPAADTRVSLDYLRSLG